MALRLEAPEGRRRVAVSCVAANTVPAMEGAAAATAGVEAPRLLTEAEALLEAGGAMQHLYLPHSEAGYERVVPLAVDPVKGVQVQGVDAEGAVVDAGAAGGGGVRWVGWPEFKAVAEKRCVLCDCGFVEEW